MLTDKSSHIFQAKNNHILLLEFNPKAPAPKQQKLFPRRIKKLQDNISSRKARTIKLLQSLDLLQLEKNQAHFTTPRQNNQKSNKISSYLSYKREQQVLRTNHNVKLFYLKSKCLETKLASKRPAQALSKSQCDSPSPQMQLSNSKLNLIVLGLNETEDNFSKPRTKSRQFYIKTSEGKRHKLNTVDYQNKLKTKLTNQNKSENKQLFQSVNQYSQSNFVTNFDQSKQVVKHRSINLRRRFNIKAKANSLSNFSRQRSTQFRPWTSNKSEYGQQ